MKEIISILWKTNKWFLVHLTFTIFLLFRLGTVTLHTYSRLSTISGTIDRIAYRPNGKGHILTLTLHGDNRAFYQRYEGRYHDNTVKALRSGDPVSFLSTEQEFEVKKSIISYSRFVEFNYYPVFNINSRKSLFDVFLFYFYLSSWWTILLYIGIVGSLLYSAQYVMRTTWRGRIIPLLLAAIFVWLMY